MEATGQYWKPVWYVLEERGFELLLVNARHVKILPGRKTDVGDAAWLCELLEHGLLRGSFVPPPAIRELTRTASGSSRPTPPSASASTRSWRTPRSGSARWPPTCLASRAGRCCGRCLPASATPRSSPPSPGSSPLSLRPVTTSTRSPGSASGPPNA